MSLCRSGVCRVSGSHRDNARRGALSVHIFRHLLLNAAHIRIGQLGKKLNSKYFVLSN